MEIKTVKTSDVINSDKKSTIGRASEAAVEEGNIYYVEINSGCNIECVMCPFSCKESFERKHNNMSLELFSQIAEKISKVSPNAEVALYHYSEPFLNTRLGEYIDIVKNHNLKVSISSNFNYFNKEMLKKYISKIDELIISVSGFYQETYSKSHQGGDIEKVKANMAFLHDVVEETGSTANVMVSYHMYMDNLGDDYRMMQQLTHFYGFKFNPIWVRSINVEMNLKYLRDKNLSRYKGKGMEYIDEIELPEEFYERLERMPYKPEDFLKGEWSDIQGDTCICDNRIINIHNDGKLECGCGFDDRLNQCDYLTADIKKYYKDRRESELCKECLANNVSFYTHYVDLKQIEQQIYNMLIDKKKEWDICDEVIGSDLEELVEFSKKHDKVYIFGGGSYGQKLQSLLEENGVYTDALVVSDKKMSGGGVRPSLWMNSTSLTSAA